MDEAGFEEFEQRLRKTIWKAGAIAGVTAVLAILVIGLCVGMGGWFYRQAKFNSQMKKEAAAQEANEKTRPEFLVQAGHVADLLHSERAATPLGWKAFNAAHEAVAKPLDSLTDESRTSREIRIAGALHDAEFYYHSCVEMALAPPYAEGNVRHCETDVPVTKIDDALRQ